jgi:CubicO group peptidase (beta-lactamase class C family)
MQRQKQRYFFSLLAALLCVGLLFWGCSSSRAPEAEPPVNIKAALTNPGKTIRIDGAVTHLHEPDNSESTVIDIVIEDDFEGTLPDDIDSITVTGPSGKLPLKKSDFNYYSQFRDFWISIPSVPEIGTYTFTVTSGNRIGLASDVLTNIKKIPIPDSRAMSPAAGATITTKSPLFSWKAVDADIPLYYRVDIKDLKDRYIYRTSYVKDMCSARLPPYILEAGRIYIWRVRVADRNNWIRLSNRSHNQWRKVSLAPALIDREYSYHMPPDTGDGWQTSSLSEEGVNEKKISDLMHRILNGYDEGKNVHSVLLVKNGKLVLEEYFCGSHRNHMHHIQSDTKSVTSLLVGIALDRNLLPGLDTKVYNFFPEYSGTKWIDQRYEIKLKHVLTMTAGLDWDERSTTYGHPRNDNTAMNRSHDWIKYVLDKETTEPPGKQFNYSGGLSILLGGLIRNTSGLHADKFAEKYLFGPLGISEYDWYKHRDGTIQTGGGLYLKSRDMAKIGFLMLNDGVWQNKQIVSRAWVRESTQAHVSTGGYRYGYQWWRGNIVKDNQVIETFWAWGHGGQFIFVIPPLDLVAVFTAKHRENPGYSERTFRMMNQFILPAMKLPGLPPEQVRVDEKALKRVVGTYRFKHDQGTEIVNIFMENRKLFGKGGDEDIAELYAESENQFFGTSDDIGGFKLQFVRDQKGDVAKFLFQFAPQFSVMRIPFDKIK